MHRQKPVYKQRSSKKVNDQFQELELESSNTRSLLSHPINTSQAPCEESSRSRLDQLPVELVLDILRYTAYERYIGDRGVIEIIAGDFAPQNSSRDPNTPGNSPKRYWAHLDAILAMKNCTWLVELAKAVINESTVYIDLHFVTGDGQTIMDRNRWLTSQVTRFKALHKLCPKIRHIALGTVRYASGVLGNADTNTSVSFTGTFLLDITIDGRFACVTCILEEHDTWFLNHYLRHGPLREIQKIDLIHQLQISQQIFSSAWQIEVQSGLLRSGGSSKFEVIGASIRDVGRLAMAQHRDSVDLSDEVVRAWVQNNGFVIEHTVEEHSTEMNLHKMRESLQEEISRFPVATY